MVCIDYAGMCENFACLFVNMVGGFIFCKGIQVQEDWSMGFED